jgi:nucleoside-diphosphate-sugar epimerase
LFWKILYAISANQELQENILNTKVQEMQIFIIGGTGNISTPITKMLQGKGHRITLFNNDQMRPEWLHPATKVITGNRKDLSSYKERIFKNGNFDCVIDMICFEPIDAAIDIEIFKGHTEHFIFCSTVDVYPKTPVCYPLNETIKIGALPSFQYAWKKVECEKKLWEAHRKGDFNLTVLRPAATYNETWSPGVHSFGGQSYHLDRIRKGKPIIMHGDGNSIWVASYCTDTASAFIGAIGNKNTFGMAYNVTGDEWMTHNQMWRTIASVMRAPEPDFVYIPSLLLSKLAPVEAEWCRENFMHNNIFDNSSAKRDLGFKYTISYERGVQKCLAYLDSHNLIENCDNYPFYDKIVSGWRISEKELTGRIRQT